MIIDYCVRYQCSVNGLSIDMLLPEPYYWQQAPHPTLLYTLALETTGALLIRPYSEATKGLVYIGATGNQHDPAQRLELKEMKLLKALSPYILLLPHVALDTSTMCNVDRLGRLLNLRCPLTRSAQPLKLSLRDHDEACSMQNLYCRSCHVALLTTGKEFVSVPSPHSNATTLESYTCHPSFESSSSLSLPQRLAQAWKKDENRIFYNQHAFYLSSMSNEHQAAHCPGCLQPLGRLDAGSLLTLSRFKVCYHVENDTVVHLLAHQLLESIQYHAQYHFILQNQLKIWVIATESWIESSKSHRPERVLLVYYQAHAEPTPNICPTEPWINMALSDSTEAVTVISTYLQQSTVALLGPSSGHSNEDRYHYDGFQLGYLLLS